MTSTSEVCGDPLVHPHPESYWGNVNPVGERSCYDEGNRYTEALVAEFVRKRGLNAVIARLFNTYGPGLESGDGRMLPNFITCRRSSRGRFRPGRTTRAGVSPDIVRVKKIPGWELRTFSEEDLGETVCRFAAKLPERTVSALRPDLPGMSAPGGQDPPTGRRCADLL